MLLSLRSVHPHLQIPFCCLSLSTQWTQQRRPYPGKRERWLTALWVRSLRLWPASALYQRLHRPKPCPPNPLHPSGKRWDAQGKHTVAVYRSIQAQNANLEDEGFSGLYEATQIFALRLMFSSYKHKLLNRIFFLTDSSGFRAKFWFCKAIPVPCLASISFTVGVIFISLYRIPFY